MRGRNSISRPLSSCKATERRTLESRLSAEFSYLSFDARHGKQDPTRAKPLLVLVWLRINVERMLTDKAIESSQLMNITNIVRMAPLVLNHRRCHRSSTIFAAD